MGGLQLDRIEEYMKRYDAKGAAKARLLTETEMPTLHDEYDGLPMMAMSAHRGPIAHVQFLPSRDLARWHMMRSTMKA